jgi:hypothetical protein
MTATPPDDGDNALVERLAAELAKIEPATRRRLIEKFLLAALGSILWIGGFLSAAANFKMDSNVVRQNTLQTEWLREHQRKLVELRAFRIWDEAETEDKRRYVSNIVVNSAGTRVCSDDVVRSWIGSVDIMSHTLP